MKHILCPAFIALLVVHCVQAAEVPVVELKGHEGYVLYALFSPDAKKVITSGQDGTVRLWDAETGKELRELEEHTGTMISVALRFLSSYHL